MSLKRKASFPNIASPQSAQGVFDRPSMNDIPKHLHSRTRKRVRNDRPDEQTVYDNTLHWLFTAQQRAQQMPMTPAGQDQDIEPDAPTPVDHRQQSLLQFFRPVQPSRPSYPSPPIRQFPNEPLRGGNELLQSHNAGSVSPATTSDSGTMSPATRLADCDMDMDLSIGNSEPNRGLRQWAG
ncbi:hypothetical protein BJY04DRAFT_195836 [Aspergillus karnatakaensis]|uniref:uncharacterized protein n=1 Tax=Aspergillus karnatakaensis TaxID=1810916 RepID=UPI003CCE382A